MKNWMQIRFSKPVLRRMIMAIILGSPFVGVSKIKNVDNRQETVVKKELVKVEKTKTSAQSLKK